MQMRISNFYRSRIGKMTPETFFCVKDKHANKDIHTLEHEGRTITDSEEIVRTNTIKTRGNHGASQGTAKRI